MTDAKNFIAKRAAKELKDGAVVNLGIGLPTLIANYIPDDVHITLHSENGFVGIGPYPSPDKVDRHLVNAGGVPVTATKDAAFFDSATSFGIARGGHLDVTFLGALQVDTHKNLSNWIVPGGKITGMGGAMDLVVGAKKVIVCTLQTNGGKSKLVSDCTLPLTAVGIVDKVITEMGVFEFDEKGFVLTEYNDEFTIDEIKQATDAPLEISKNLKKM